MASNLIAVVETEVERRARCMTRENSSKCRNVEQIFYVSTSRAVFDDERKEMFFFLKCRFSENFLSPKLLGRKNVDGSKSSCARCFEAAKLFLIDELKLEQFFF